MLALHALLKLPTNECLRPFLCAGTCSRSPTHTTVSWCLYIIYVMMWWSHCGTQKWMYMHAQIFLCMCKALSLSQMWVNQLTPCPGEEDPLLTDFCNFLHILGLSSGYKTDTLVFLLWGRKQENWTPLSMTNGGCLSNPAQICGRLAQANFGFLELSVTVFKWYCPL